jgi:hypothetical protein
LFELKTTVGVMTITTFHHSFKNLVMKWLVEVGPNFAMAADAELRLADLQQMDS